MAALLVPELYVSNLRASLRFYQGLIGFDLVYERPEERFAYLGLGGAEIMLEEPVGRSWLLGKLDHPFGRGVNLQIAVSGVDALHEKCAAANVPVFLAPETKQYRRKADEIAVRQFIVQDPDGYLLRFSEPTAQRSGDPA